MEQPTDNKDHTKHSHAHQATDMLGKILHYADSPFKLFAIIIMSVLGFSGYLLWHHKDIIIDTYQEHQKLPEIAEGRIDDAVTHLFKHTNAQVVAIFKVNPILDNRILYRSYTREGRDKTVEGLDVGLFTSNINNNRDVVALMSGEIPCGEYLQAQSEVGLWYIEKGMRYGCRVSIPPEAGRFIGQITVGWDNKPDDLEHTKTMIMIAASMLSREKK